MVGYRRNLIDGGTYFFTINLHDRRADTLVRYVDLLRAAVRETRLLHPFMVDAMVILPDHIHAIWTLPPGDANYAHRIRLLKSKFTRSLRRVGVPLNKDGRGEYDLWQKRYWEHTIGSEADLEAHINYVHINPVKHGLTARAVDWPHSSIHRFIREGKLPEHWACEIDPVIGRNDE